jgi:SAM-dependent methyltransferase
MRRALPERFCCEDDLCWIGSDGLHADEDLDAWRSGRLYDWTRELTDVLVKQGVEGLTVLDIGAGVGAVHLGLLEAGATRAIDVDASREYLTVAAAEAERRGLADRVEHRFGDVVELAGSLPPADIVTLDSVICCYPYLERLMGAALASGPSLVGLTFPRNTWWMVLYMRLHNLRNALTRRHDNYFIHRYARVVQLMTDAGYAQIHDGGTRLWRVVVFRRVAPGVSERTSSPS